MDVAPHPHIGLQTVTWLHEGEVVHDDSLGSASILRPGGVNVMTSGAGIAHAEQTPREHTGRLDGVQLWTALPEAHRHGAPGFAHVAEVPVDRTAGGIVHVFAGGWKGHVAGALLFAVDRRGHAGPSSPEAGLPARADVRARRAGDEWRLRPRWRAARRACAVLPGHRATGRRVSSRAGARVLLIGGPPFPETILMWWNFVARTPEEIAEARDRLGGAPSIR